MTDIIIRKRGLQIAFTCKTCGQIDLYSDPRAKPVHCHRDMDRTEFFHIDGDPSEIRLGILHLDRGFTPGGFPKHSGRDWPNHWEDPCELWQFRPGIENGERLGWFGRHPLLAHWEWIAPAGVGGLGSGACPTRLEALNHLWTLINRG